jgi:hypothetical protein
MFQAQFAAHSNEIVTASVAGPLGTVSFLALSPLDSSAWQSRVHELENPKASPIIIDNEMFTLNALDTFLEMAVRRHDAPGGNAANAGNADEWERAEVSMHVLTGETSAVASHPFFDFWPSILIVDEDPLRFSSQSRSGGASEDLVLHPPSP